MADFLDLIGLPVQRPADHQQSAVGAQQVELRRDRDGGGHAEHHFIHGAEYDASAAHDLVLPGYFALWLGVECSGGSAPKENTKMAPTGCSRRGCLDVSILVNPASPRGCFVLSL